MSRLYMLAFEHRGTFRKMIFGSTDPISEAERELLISFKHIIWEGLKIVAEKRGAGDLAISVDEEYGEEIHREAHRLGIRNALPVEKSGRPAFEFEHPNWQEHFHHIRPTYAKALVRVYPVNEGPAQYERLRSFSRFCQEEGLSFLLEPIILPSEKDLSAFDGDRQRFEQELRPKRFVQAVRQFHDEGIFPDIWKIEGTEMTEAMKICVGAVLSGAKGNPQIIISGRGGNMEQVENWLRIGAKFPEVTGFAIGRTIFKDALCDLYKKNISPEEAPSRIAAAMEHFIGVFEEGTGNNDQ